MTEQDRKELIKMGFRQDDGWLLWGKEEFIDIGINYNGDIYLFCLNAEMFLDEYESITQIRRKIEGLKMLLS